MKINRKKLYIFVIILASILIGFFTIENKINLINKEATSNINKDVLKDNDILNEENVTSEISLEKEEKEAGQNNESIQNITNEIITENESTQEIITKNESTQEVITGNESTQEIITKNESTQEVITGSESTQEVITERKSTKEIITERETTNKTTTVITGLNEFDAESYINEVIRLVNVERNSIGVSSLIRNEDLCNIASMRAIEIVEKFSHTRQNGADCFTIFDEYGFLLNGYAGENLAKGHRTPQEVVNGWMNSEGHKQNILSSNFKEIGIGIVKNNGIIYWTQIFYGSAY